MSSEFLKDFDSLLDQILVDYSNQDSAPDTTAGSITYIKAACLASMLWGLYRYQDYLAKQIFLDTADTDNLNHHGYILGITRDTDESDSDYVARLLAFIQQPPAGGNKKDYADWAKDTPGVTGVGFTGIAYVESATVITPREGLSPGNIAITIVPDNEFILGATGMQDLVDSCYEYVDAQRPVTANQLTVQQPTTVWINPHISVTAATGDTLDKDTMLSDILAFMNEMLPGDPLYRSKLESICIQDGAIAASVTYPGADVTTTTAQIIRAVTANISVV